MFSLTKLLLLILAGVTAVYWWQSGMFKGRARELAIAHCRQLDLQLLDQSMVITGIWPALSGSGSGKIEFRRTYQFEFSSIGDRRYQGLLVMQGLRLKSIELETYKLPDPD
jgi:hypothetical protein